MHYQTFGLVWHLYAFFSWPESTKPNTRLDFHITDENVFENFFLMNSDSIIIFFLPLIGNMSFHWHHDPLLDIVDFDLACVLHSHRLSKSNQATTTDSSESSR